MQYCSSENTQFFDYCFQFTDLPTIYIGCYLHGNMQKMSMSSLLHHYLYAKRIDEFVKTLLIVPDLSEHTPIKAREAIREMSCKKEYILRTDKSFPTHSVCMLLHFAPKAHHY